MLCTTALEAGSLPPHSPHDHVGFPRLRSRDTPDPAARRRMHQRRVLHQKYCGPLSRAESLETLTILDLESCGSYNDWWLKWDSFMESHCFGCDAGRFYTRIVCPGRPGDVVVTRDNYPSLERGMRRRLREKFPDSWEEGAEGSDSDDEQMSAPHRFRQGWRHAKICTCRHKRQR